jgi:hypothetical protein
MTLLALYLTIALGGAIFALWRPPRMPRYWPLLAIAAVPQLGGTFGIWIPGMFLVSVTAIFVWCLANRAVTGVLIVGAGVALNLLAMAFHGGAMPIRADVLAGIGHAIEPGTLLMGSKDIVVRSTVLWLLSDWLVLPSALITIVASPGDLIVIVGVMTWLLFSHTREKDQPMMTLRVTSNVDHGTRLLSGQSSRPALTRLALLAAANPDVAESLLHDPVGAATAHPHYAVPLDARDRATLADIRARARTVGEFMADLADVVDGRLA